MSDLNDILEELTLRTGLRPLPQMPPSVRETRRALSGFPKKKKVWFQRKVVGPIMVEASSSSMSGEGAHKVSVYVPSKGGDYREALRVTGLNRHNATYALDNAYKIVREVIGTENIQLPQPKISPEEWARWRDI